MLAWSADDEGGQATSGLLEHIKPSFLLFGDLYSIPSHHLEDFDGESGWWTRRIYATLDFEKFGLGDTVARLRLEANQSDEPGNTDYESTLKDAYLEFRPSRHEITVGRSSTTTCISQPHAVHRRAVMVVRRAPNRCFAVAPSAEALARVRAVGVKELAARTHSPSGTLRLPDVFRTPRPQSSIPILCARIRRSRASGCPRRPSR